MKAYITCPVTHTQNKTRILSVIEQVVKNNGHDTFVFKIGGPPKEIFTRDFRELKSSDLLIAEISEPSHGVGAEIGMSYCFDLDRILLYERGKNVSKFLSGMPRTTIMEYITLKDLKYGLDIHLKKNYTKF